MPSSSLRPMSSTSRGLVSLNFRITFIQAAHSSNMLQEVVQKYYTDVSNYGSLSDAALATLVLKQKLEHNIAL